MIASLEPLLRPFLRMLDAEDAHRLAIAALKLPPLGTPAADDARLRVRAFGLDFPNPIGMSAGFDKHAEVPDALIRLGFGFVEVGTVTPKPQFGNPRPRVFRLPQDGAVINRLGFNSEGADVVRARLANRAERPGILGVNVGANKESADRTDDYLRMIEFFTPLASYVTVNISSPNTPGLRGLQEAKAFDDLLSRIFETRARLPGRAAATPLLIKIAPDLTLAELDDIISAARRHRIDGMIVANTTVQRPAGLRDTALAREAGGFSGRPLFNLATRMLAESYIRTEGAFPLIGSGGIDSGAAALAKIHAGARLIQLYSALVFAGLRLVSAIKSELASALARGGHRNIDPLVGTEAAALTAQPWPK